jgi:hypothetical protein
MSYSRWSHSDWYSFWNCYSVEGVKEKQSLSLWTRGKILDWSYDDLTEMTISDIQRIYECDLETAEEGMMYIREFIEDVNYSFEDDNGK